MANFNSAPRPTGPHLAARARRLTPEEWNHRALELAWNERTIGTLRYLMTDPDGTHLYSAASRSRPELPHVIRINVQRTSVTCDCEAASWGSPCSHAGAALYALQQMISSTGARNMAGQRQYEYWANMLSPTALDAS